METGRSDKEVFNDLIQDHTFIGDREELLLSKWCNTFPYSALPFFLLIQSEFQKQDQVSEKLLSKCAIRIGSRSHLFREMQIERIKEAIEAFEEEVVERAEDLMEPIESATEAEIKEEETQKDELNENILIEAVDSTISQEVEADIAEQRDHLESDDTETNARTYAEWIYQRAQAVHWSEEMRSEEEEKPKDPASIIDAFIRKSPSISRPTTETPDADEKAKLSLVEDDQFVTESLAMIYARQGKIEKARKAYKLLSLKYPEKSIYFAAQLKKLGKSKPNPN